MRSAKDIPPLQALRAFEAAGRLLSFRKAGEELLITQSAVSHHIKQLEADLGCRLFVRKAKSIDLTAQGERYLTRIALALDDIRSATLEVQSEMSPKRLRVSLLPSFATNFLLSRISRFQAAHPEIELELDPTTRVVDIGRGDADVAIRFGDGQWDGLECSLLQCETLFPVVGAERYGDGSGFRHAESLLNHPLLFSLRPTEWQVWTEAAGLDLRYARMMQLNDYNVALQAAMDGHGVLMGRRLLIQPQVDRGQLIQLFDLTIQSSRAAYWSIHSRHTDRLAHIQAFVGWLKEEMDAVC